MLHNNTFKENIRRSQALRRTVVVDIALDTEWLLKYDKQVLVIQSCIEQLVKTEIR